MIIVTLLSLFGVVLNIYKRRECFTLWIITNSIWSIYDFRIGAWEQGILFSIYTGLAIWGRYKWSITKEEDMGKKVTVLSELQEIKEVLKRLVVKEIIIPAARQINDRFTDNGDGTITDKQEKVTWVKDPTALKGFESIMTWPEAKAACEKLSFAGYNSGWRMPTLKEEQSIRDYTKHDPAWDTDVFAGKHDNWYWTSMECAWNHDAAWCVYSGYGDVFFYGKGVHTYVRPVRSCQ